MTTNSFILALILDSKILKQLSQRFIAKRNIVETNCNSLHFNKDNKDYCFKEIINKT